jgi:hypothetical protein
MIDTGAAGIPKNISFEVRWRKLNRNQQRFVIALPEYSSRKECAEGIGMSAGTIYGWPKEVFKVAELYQDHIADVATSILVDGISRAALIKVGGLDSEDERISQMSATEILDRYFGKAKQRTEHTGEDGGPVTVELVSLGGIDPDEDI